jgi:hypothetical protein
MRCPYCDKNFELDACEHLLLILDTQFNELLGGVMMDITQNRLSELSEIGLKSKSPKEAFEALLDEIEQIAEFDMEEEYDFGPGSSGTYRYYFSARPKDSIDGYLGLIHSKDRD